MFVRIISAIDGVIYVKVTTTSYKIIDILLNSLFL